MTTDLVMTTGLAGAVLFVVLNIAGLLTWVERKQSALMQDRIGANRASFTMPGRWLTAPINFMLRKIAGLGLLHPLADVLKMLSKEDYVPPTGNRLLHWAAPFVSVVFALVAFAAIPFGHTLPLAGRTLELRVTSIDAGLLYVLALASLGIYGVFLAGMASNNNYAFLGALRAAAQMLSYEITLGVALMGAVMVYGTVDLQEMVQRQGALFFGWLPSWGIITQPLASLLFLVAGIAETKRVPFDLPEGESEIIGYFVEYSGMKFGMFFLADFIESVLIAALWVTLFLGGWQVPYLQETGFVFPWGGGIAMSAVTVSLCQVGVFLTKLVGMLWLLMQVRWTLPRFRYDQLMRLGWKVLFPLSLANIAVTALVIVGLGR